MPRYRSHRVVIQAGSLAALLFLTAMPARAVCLEPRPIRACSEFFHVDDVFTGKVVATKQIPQPPDPNNIEGWLYTVAGSKSYRGATGKTIEVWGENAGEAFTLEQGHSYLLFVKKGDTGRLEADRCGNSGEIDKSADAIKAVEQVVKDAKSASGGDIGGRITIAEANTRTLTEKIAPGVQVIANGPVQDQSSGTDKDGNFHIHVPAGKYSLMGVSKDWNVIPYPLSYSPSDAAMIENGGCADVQLLALPK